MVILHVTAPARVGGLERVVEALSVGHARAGHAVHVAAVVSSVDDGQRFLRPMAAHGVQVHPIVLPGRAYVRERSEVRELCRMLRPSVVHTHGYRADVATSGVARQLDIPTVTTVHGFTGGGWRNRLYEGLQVRAFRRFAGVVAVSQPLASLLESRGVPASRLRVIVNAWSSTPPSYERAAARAELGLPASGVCVVWLGRLTAEKGADVLIDAIPSLDPGVIVSLIGDGAERMRLEQRAAELGVSSQIRWHGIVNNAGALLRAFDAFVLSSRTEGTPIAMFEAMAADLPIIATRVGGVPDVITAKDAILVPPENPDAIAAAIRETIGNRGESEARARSAKQRLATTFAVAPWLAAYERLYRAVSGEGV